MPNPYVELAQGAVNFRDERFVVKSAVPLLARKIGTLVTGADIVSRYADPVWKIQFVLGPLSRVNSKRLRDWIGSETLTVRFRFEDRLPADWPNAEIWMNSTITATLLNAKPKSVNADITRGDLWTVDIQAAESAMVAIP